MADDRSRSSKPSWRRKSSDAPRPEVSGYEWTRRRVKPVGTVGRPRSREFKIAGALLGLFTCLALIVLLIILFRPPKPAAVVLVGADYAGNLTVPHNVLGWKGIQAVEAVSRAPRDWPIFVPAQLQLILPKPRSLDLAEQWDGLIGDVKRAGRRQETILFVVALHGGSTADAAYLIPNQMTGPEDKKLDLGTVIASMKELPPEQNKILVLEGGLIPADWRLGMLRNDFARHLRDLEGEILKIPNLWVLSACDVGQVCCASEGLNRSVFLHFITEALRGKGVGPGARLTLDELYTYVRTNVRKWAWNARGAIQEPVLLPRRDNGAGGTAGSARRTPPSRVYLATVEAAGAIESPPKIDRGKLQQRWEAYRELDQLEPHPSLYSPRRWREYRACLVRFDELLRARATPDQVRPVEARLEILGGVLNDERFLMKLPESHQNSLVSDVIRGGVVDSKSTDPQAYLNFWSPPAGLEAAKVWETLVGAEPRPGNEPRRPLRSLIDDYVIRRVEGNPFDNLRTAAQRLGQTRGNDYPQPAEAHFLVMLEKYLGPVRNDRHPSLWPRVGRALTVRRQAERAALGIVPEMSGYARSEQLLPWIRGPVEKADAKRRLGEDRLFSAQDADWSRSDKDLEGAEALYAEALRRAGKIRAALAIRDRALVELPDYARWIPRRYPEDLLKDDLSAGLSELWSQVHSLSDMLDTPPVSGDSDLGPLEQTARSIASGLEQLARTFVDEGRRPPSERPRGDYEASTAAAAVPFRDSRELNLRSKIWDHLDVVGEHDLVVAREGGKGEPSDAEKKDVAEVLRRQARIQGLMSIAALGRAWFDDPVFKEDQGRFDQTREQIITPGQDDDDASTPWWKQIAVAGERTGSRWQGLVMKIDELAADENRLADARVFRDRLRRADRLARLLDGEATPVPESKTEASSILRLYRVHDLLLWLAERTWNDHWYDADPKAIKPYYRDAGQRFASDAADLVARSADAARIQKLLEGTDRLRLDGPPGLVLTSEPSKDVSYRVSAEGEPPPGLPVIRPEPDSDIQVEGGTAGYRLAPWRTGGDRVGFTVFNPTIRDAERDPKLTVPRLTRSRFTVSGMFRGQHFASVTDVELHPRPDMVAIGPPPADPPAASLAVRASGDIIQRYGEGHGSIAIVLDCSGSMIKPVESKFTDAKNALTKVLEDIVPRGTTVSLWTFSQLPGDVVRPFVNDPIVLEPERTINLLRPPSRWDPGQAGMLAGQLNQLRPYLETPLVEAMWKAADTDLRNVAGLKTLLVLTDGMDSRFLASRTLDRRGATTIPQFLSRFNEIGAKVNMVFFTTPQDKTKDVEEARKNFENPLQDLNPPGSFVTAKNIDELYSRLRKAMRQKLVCQILKPNGTIVGEEPLDVTGPGEEDKWFWDGLEPGIYTLRIHADQTFEAHVNLSEGERLLVKLVDSDGSIGFVKELYSDDFTTRKDTDAAGWRLSGLADLTERNGDGDQLQVMASLERKPDLTAGQKTIRQSSPRLAWFKLDAQNIPDPEAVYTVKWRERRFFPAPVWQLDVAQWPRDPAGARLAIPILRAWWLESDQKLAPSGVFLMGRNSADAAGTVRIDDNHSVSVESVGIEPHLVEVQPGRAEEKSCLTVRLAFPTDTPYFVDPGLLTGLETEIAGHEHRFYTRAGRYTGLFWPVNEAQFNKLTSLGLVSLPEILKRAEKQKAMAEIKLPPPQPGRLPKPIILRK